MARREPQRGFKAAASLFEVRLLSRPWLHIMFLCDSDEEDGPETPAMSAPPVLACNKLRYQRFGNNSNSVSVESERGLEIRGGER